jgi:hypothetical protein
VDYPRLFSESERTRWGSVKYWDDVGVGNFKLGGDWVSADIGCESPIGVLGHV